MPFLRPKVSVAPTLLDSILTGQIENSGTTTVTTTLGISTAGILLVSVDCVRTAIFAGPPTLNNSNTFDSSPIINEAYTPSFGQYSLRVYKKAGVSGGSAHSSVLTKSSGDLEETTKVLIGVSGATTATGTATVTTASGAGATNTSANYTVASGSNAVVIALWSGTGFATDGTVQSASMITSGFSLIQSFWHNNVTAPNGHIPLAVWYKVQGPGTYQWQAAPLFNEGGIMGTVVVQ